MRGQCERRPKRVAVPRLGENGEMKLEGQVEARSQRASNATPEARISLPQLFLESSIIWPAFWKRGP